MLRCFGYSHSQASKDQESKYLGDLSADVMFSSLNHRQRNSDLHLKSGCNHPNEVLSVLRDRSTKEHGQTKYKEQQFNQQIKLMNQRYVDAVNVKSPGIAITRSNAGTAEGQEKETTERLHQSALCGPSHFDLNTNREVVSKGLMDAADWLLTKPTPVDERGSCRHYTVHRLTIVRPSDQHKDSRD
jgi:hypothetical protein